MVENIERSMSNRPLLLTSNQAWSKYWVSKHWIANEESKRRKVLYIAPFRATKNPFKWGRYTTNQINPNLLEISPSGPKGFYRLPLFLRVYFIRVFFGCLKRSLPLMRQEKAIEFLSFDASWSIAMGDSYFYRHIYYPVDPPMGWGKDADDVKAHQSSKQSYSISTYRSKYLRKEYGVDAPVLPHAITGITNNWSDKVNEEMNLVSQFKQEGFFLVVYVGSLNKNCFDLQAVRCLLKSDPKIKLVVYAPLLKTELSYFDDSLIIESDRVHYRGALDYPDVSAVCSFYDAAFIPYDMSVNNNWGMRAPFKASNYVGASVPFVAPVMPASEDYYGVGVFYRDIDEIAHAFKKLRSSSFRDNYYTHREKIIAERSIPATLETLFSSK